MALNRIAQAIRMFSALSDPQIVIQLGGRVDRVRPAACSLDHAAPAFHLGIDQTQEILQGPVVGRGFLEGRHFIPRPLGLRAAAGLHVAQVVINPVDGVAIENPTRCARK